MGALLTAGAVAAVQMVVVVIADGATRAGYDPWRNWVSQLSLGPHGWLGVTNLAICAAWLFAYAIGLRGCLRPSRTARWAVRLVLICAAGLTVVAAFPIDAGLDFPPGAPAVHTFVGFVHQVGALAMFGGGTCAAVVLGRCAGLARAGLAVAAVMAVSFTGAAVLVTLDVSGIVVGTPSGLLERIALFTGFGWIGLVGLRLRTSTAR
jgi:Protein of unknown function (DUF998)